MNYFNENSNVQFTAANLVDNEGIVEYAHNYITIFDRKELLQFLAKRSNIADISIPDDIKLIKFLYEYFHTSQDSTASHVESLSDLSILYDTEGKLRRFNELFFPSNYQEQNREVSDVAILDEEIYDSIKDDSSIIEWLVALGVRDLSNDSFIDYILSNPDYITLENALSIGTNCRNSRSRW